MSVADEIRPFIMRMLGDEPPVAFRFWDGSGLGGGSTAIVMRSPAALRRLLTAPGELGFARAYVAGDLDIDGDIFQVLRLRDRMVAPTEELGFRLGPRSVASLARAGRRLNALGRPSDPPPEEVRLRGRLHSKERDAAAVSHHYDVGNDFYEIVLGPSMTYSCAYFARDDMDLEAAQEAKYDHIARKLGLRAGMRLLDVGCGWGGMALHAARNYGASVVGITLARSQADLAAKRVAEAGLADRIEIRLQDYRDVTDGPFDAISSIGMFEHVGAKRIGEYFKDLTALLVPRGRLLNHAISRPMGAGGFGRRSFVARYVFPDGELLDVGTVATQMHAQGLEVRDVEALREHYARTLRAWVSNLEASWDEAAAIVGPGRARVWRLYMAGSALSFEAGRINVHQVLGVKVDDHGRSGLPSTRDELMGRAS